MTALTVVFRTHSDIEANVVQALLESHGVESVRTAGAPPGMFPFTVSTLGETRVSVREAEAEEAVRIIESHRE
jgi:type III secretory pathway lipoprotein EscJ